MLLDTISGELEPALQYPGWFQLTGRRIVRAVSYGEFFAGCNVGVDRRVVNARVIGIHDQPAAMEGDERFNGADPKSFAVVAHADGSFSMVLEVHMVEAVLFRFLTPATRPDHDEPLPRVESVDESAPFAHLSQGVDVDP